MVPLIVSWIDFDGYESVEFLADLLREVLELGAVWGVVFMEDADQAATIEGSGFGKVHCENIDLIICHSNQIYHIWEYAFFGKIYLRICMG